MLCTLVFNSSLCEAWGNQQKTPLFNRCDQTTTRSAIPKELMPKKSFEHEVDLVFFKLRVTAWPIFDVFYVILIRFLTRAVFALLESVAGRSSKWTQVILEAKSLWMYVVYCVVVFVYCVVIFFMRDSDCTQRKQRAQKTLSGNMKNHPKLWFSFFSLAKNRGDIFSRKKIIRVPLTCIVDVAFIIVIFRFPVISFIYVLQSAVFA